MRPSRAMIFTARSGRRMEASIARIATVKQRIPTGGQGTPTITSTSHARFLGVVCQPRFPASPQRGVPSRGTRRGTRPPARRPAGCSHSCSRSQTPLYPAYAAIAHRAGGISALGDQELAAGVMIGIGGIPFALAVFIQIYQWLDEERPPRARRQAPKPTRTAGA
jgi:hypothetical protein